MSQSKAEIVVGCLVSVSNSMDGGRWLGLVVDQNAGRKWAERDPCIEYDPPDTQGFVIARVLGLKLTEGMALNKSGLPEEEPDEIETVRWAYAQLNHAYVVAGPNVDSIETFLSQCRTCQSLGMLGAAFLDDLRLIVEHLKGVTRAREKMSSFDMKFLAMLGEVLPR